MSGGRALEVRDFISLGHPDELAALYPALPEAERLPRAHQDWLSLAREEARRQAAAGPPPALPAVTVEAAGVEYAIYGLIHGLVGGESRAYRDFVRASLEPLRAPVMENGLKLIYRQSGAEEIPDFSVLGVVGALWGGLLVALQYPMILWALCKELLRQESPDPDFELAGGPLYHAVEPEIRRALEPEGDLPSGLSVALEMGAWEENHIRARLKDPAALVPRSLFMAGYAAGCAERRGVRRIEVVVGDRHTAEVSRFLSEPQWREHPLFVWGRRFAAQPDLRRRWRFRLAKMAHLSLMSLPSLLLLIPALLLLNWWLLREQPTVVL